MFCMKCGAELNEGTRFCVKCGEPVRDASAGQQPGDAPRAVPGSVQVAGPAVRPEAVQAPSGAGRIAFIVGIIAIAAIVAVAAIVVVPPLLGGGSDRNGGSSASSVTSASSPASSTASSQGESAAAAEPVREEGSSTASASQEGGASVVDESDLRSDRQAFHDMNLFLSNFSEVDFIGMDDVGDLIPADLVKFAISHDGLNSPQFWEAVDDPPQGKDGKPLTYRESFDRIEEVVMRYFGVEVDCDMVSVATGFMPTGGYVYFNGASVVGSPAGVACVSDSEKLADGSLKVSFNVVTSAGGYDATDDSLYSCSFDELLTRLGAGMAAYQGVAVVGTGFANDYTNGFTLESYSRSDR